MKANENRSIAPEDESKEFEQRFSSCRGLLRQIAERVLNGDNDVEEALQRSYAAAVGQRRRFQSDGEFRRWLVRRLLNEALMMLHEKESGVEGATELPSWQAC